MDRLVINMGKLQRLEIQAKIILLRKEIEDIKLKLPALIFYRDCSNKITSEDVDSMYQKIEINKAKIKLLESI